MKLSIVMLTYGHAKFIKQAIEGVLIQNVDFEIELLIANDNSPDGTHSIIKNILKEDPRAALRIKYNKHSKNLGIMANFIWALRQCKGEFIALCEGDDYWTDPLKLQKQVEFLVANPEYVLTHHDTSIIDENGNHLKDSKLTVNKKRDFNKCELQRDLSLATLTLCFRNIFLNKEFDFPNVVNGDLALISILGLYGKGKYMEGIQNACYRVHSGGIWSQTDRIKQNTAKYETFHEMSSYYFRLGNIELGAYYRKRLKQQFKVIFLYYINKRNFKEAIRIFIRFNMYYIQSNSLFKTFIER